MGFAPGTTLQSLPAYLSEAWEGGGWAEKLGEAVTRAGRDVGRVGFAIALQGMGCSSVGGKVGGSERQDSERSSSIHFP